MATRTTFITLDRNITKWRWYTDPNTFRVWVHLLLNATPMDREYKGIALKRGDVLLTLEEIGNSLNLSTQCVRTAISHLKLTGEITTSKSGKSRLIRLTNYSSYQDKEQKNQQIQLTEYQHDANTIANNSSYIYNNNKNNNNNNISNTYTLPHVRAREEEQEVVETVETVETVENSTLHSKSSFPSAFYQKIFCSKCKAKDTCTATCHRECHVVR